MWFVITYDCGIDKGAPAALFLEQSEDEGYGSGAEKDDNELVLELLKDELPEWGRRVLRQFCAVL